MSTTGDSIPPLTDGAPTTLVERARATLRANDRGGYTVPSPRLYPFQWNWDSAVVALGWMTFDEPRAWQEIERLLSGQWESGLVPHIIFHQPSDTYFPGPAEWGLSHRNPPTSSISQPPLLATIVREMAGRARDLELAHRSVARLLPKLLASHRWWYRARDPLATGLVVIYHPWESGMDNSPAWDAPIAAVPGTTRPYTRRDTGHVPAAQRPNQSDYDRYVYLLDWFREVQFNAAALYAESPFCVVDFGLNAILLRATDDLAALCEENSNPSGASEMRSAAQRARAALAGLWSDALGQFVSFDRRTNRPLEVATHATFLAWYAGLVDRSPARAERDARLIARLDAWLAAARFGVASTDPASPVYDPAKYWRGPIWPHVNWLIARGLRESIHFSRAERLRADTLALIARGGLREYFNPDTGEAYGGDQFSWTAAVTLFWANDGAGQ